MLKPTILKCHYCNYETHAAMPERRVMDYEFDLYLSEGRKTKIGDVWYEPSEGCLMVRRPGQTIVGSGTFHCYMLTLDFSSEKRIADYSRNRAHIQQPLCKAELLEVLPPFIVLSHYEECLHLLRRIEFYTNTLIDEYEKAQDLTMEFLHLIAADAYHKKARQQASYPKFGSLCRFLQTHYQEPLTLEIMAAQVHFNKSYLVRAFKREVGVSPMMYLTNVRLENAKMLLIETDSSVKEIAAICGYQNAAYFSNYFKKVFHMTPMEFRMSISKGSK